MVRVCNGQKVDLLDLRHMEKALTYLKRLYPERIAFTEEEKEFASGLLRVFLMKDDCQCQMPTRFVPVGEVCVHGAVKYCCVKRPKVVVAGSACDGCDIARKYRGCGNLQCSSYDRKDRENVWFVEVEN